MSLAFLILTSLMNSLVVHCTNPNQFPSFHLSSSLTESNSSTTQRPYYPDTFSPGSIAGVAIGSLLLIFIISFGSCQIRRQKFYHLPYYNNNYQQV